MKRASLQAAMGWEWRLFFDGDHRATFEEHMEARFPTFRRKDSGEELRCVDPSRGSRGQAISGVLRRATLNACARCAGPICTSVSRMQSEPRPADPCRRPRSNSNTVCSGKSVAPSWFLFERACQGSLWPCEPTSVATPGANTAAAPGWQWSKVRVPRPSRETVESVPSQSPANQVLADVKTIVEQNEWGQDTVPGRGATVVALTKSRLMYKVRSIDSCHHYAGSSVMFTILCALCSKGQGRACSLFSRAIMKKQLPAPDDADRKHKLFKGIGIECSLVALKDHPNGRLFTSVCIEHPDDAKKIYAVTEAFALSDFAVAWRLSGTEGSGMVAEDDGGNMELSACVQGFPTFCLYAARVLQESRQNLQDLAAA